MPRSTTRRHRSAARSLGLVMPFIEVPDMALGEGQRPNAASFVAYDVLPRFGILGTGVAVEATPAFVDALGRLAVTVTDGTGRTVAEGSGRSEEHTSVLQSLMRISYAVFCLKKKKQ